YTTGLDSSRNNIALDSLRSQFWITDNDQYAVVDILGNIVKGPFNIPNVGTSQMGLFGPEPVSVLFAADHIWMATSNSLLKFQPPNTTPIAIYPIAGSSLQELAFDGTYLWASTYNSGDFIKIRPSDGKQLATLSSSKNDYNHILEFDGANLWAFPWSTTSTADKPDLKMPVIIQPISSIPPPDDYQLVAPPRILNQGNFIWITSTKDNRLIKLQAATGQLIHTIELGTRPLAMDISNSHLWVVVEGGKVLKVDYTSGPVAEFNIAGAKHIAVDSNTNQVWVAGTSGVTRIDTNGATQIFLSGNDIDNVFYALNRIWVKNLTADTLQGLDTNGNVQATVNPPPYSLPPSPPLISPLQDMADDGANLFWAFGFIPAPYNSGPSVLIPISYDYQLYQTQPIPLSHTTLITETSSPSEVDGPTLRDSPWLTYDNQNQHLWFSTEINIQRYDLPSGDKLSAKTCTRPAGITYNASTQSVWAICWGDDVARKLSGYQGILTPLGSPLTKNPLPPQSSLSSPTESLYLPFIIKAGSVQTSTRTSLSNTDNN
ncbi:MAG: hypothetical protein AAF485_24270, partial [Chloroflexota bacterium]